jgi:3-(3-hydroxy-phenyl)propionate hydroxylase
VIIVGGGPVGLICALTLAQHDIPVLVLEAHEDLFFDLRAGRFIRRRWKFWRRAASPKSCSTSASSFRPGNYATAPRASLARSNCLRYSRTKRRTPYRLHCEQHKLTPLVYDMLKGMPNVDVRFSSRVTQVTQHNDGVTVVAETPDGTETLKGSWVIGADGGGSIVRKSADIKFDGFTYPEKFALISTSYDLGARGFTDNCLYFASRRMVRGVSAAAFRPAGTMALPLWLQPRRERRRGVERLRVEQRLQSVLPKEGRYDTIHRTIYRVHQRVADNFRSGRMLLAGDSAHLNNPLGGFGLNSALQDAINLTDKLIALWHGNADDSVLDRYVRQRRTVNIEYVQESSIRNKRLLEETDPTLRKQRLDEMRRASETPALAKEVVMKSSMIASMRRANAIT